MLFCILWMYVSCHTYASFVVSVVSWLFYFRKVVLSYGLFRLVFEFLFFLLLKLATCFFTFSASLLLVDFCGCGLFVVFFCLLAVFV